MFGHNKSSGLFSGGQGGMSGAPMVPRQLNLVASEGFSGNGMATIGSDNTFSLLANLPPPHTVSPYSPAVYAAYLVDGRGQNGFYVGTLRPAGNGMFQTNFKSPVPLIHYDKVVVSLESPQRISQAPQGPIVMMVKGGILDGLGPVKKIGGNMWGKVKGFVGTRFGGKAETVPEQAPIQQQFPASQYPGQQAAYPQQGGYPQGGYSQSYPQGSYPQQGGYQGGFQRGIPSGYQGGRQRSFQGIYHGGQAGYQGAYQGQQVSGQQPYQPPINPGNPVNSGIPVNPGNSVNQSAPAAPGNVIQGTPVPEMPAGQPQQAPPVVGDNTGE